MAAAEPTRSSTRVACEPLFDFAGRPGGITVDSGGTVYLSDLDSATVWRIGLGEITAPVLKKITLRDTPGWAAWLGSHLMYLIGFRNRLIVLINWAWRYLRWPSGPRLIGETGIGPVGDRSGLSADSSSAGAGAQP